MLNFSNQEDSKPYKAYQPPEQEFQDPVEKFREHMAQYDLFPQGPLILDGKTHRFGEDNVAWYAGFHDGDFVAGSCAAWNWGEVKKTFCSKKKGEMSPEEDARIQKRIKQINETQVAEKKIKHAQAKIQANEQWKAGTPVEPGGHPYLVNKGLKHGYGLKLGRDHCGRPRLLVPTINEHGQLVSLQYIDENGVKQNQPGGERKGMFYRIPGDFGTNNIIIGEGLATVATIWDATGADVICSFTAGNIPVVAPIIRKMYPNHNIIIAADNDIEKERQGKGNAGKEKGEEAANAIEAKFCLCPYDSDFNDLYMAQGLEAVKTAFKKTWAVSGEEWEKPIPLNEDHVQTMDPAILPDIVGDMAKAVSIETETPIELAVGLILSVLATACQGKIIIQIKPGYQEPLNIWVVTALGPANRKSSVLIKITKPLNQWERWKHAELEPAIKQDSIKLKNQEARLKSLRGKYGSANKDELEDIEAEILDIENNLVQVPIFPKLWAQDITTEHLGTLLNAHDEKMSIISAEGGIFEIIGGRYSGGVANLDLFLQGHSGDPVRVDRGSREPVLLDNPALTLGLSPQPEVLRGLADKPGFRGKGLLARILYFLPKSNLGHRGLDSEPVPENIKNNYNNLVCALLNIEHDENESGERRPYVLHLSKGAYREWSDFYMTVEKDLREGGRFEYLTDWAGKLPGAAARIAGLLHCAQNPHKPWEQKVELETMENALEIASILSDHALIAFDLMGADISLEGARKVWRWVKRNRLEVFTKRDCFNAHQGKFQKVSKLEEPLKVLVEHHYIQELTKKTGGRPSIEYSVNPEFAKRWA
ncbi:MAG: DUF3987 domain-containing protein [Proteobacteria bacterium]|nr:DUF3987 domain-containing protein [Desulfobacula sp.]MBU3951511.1 DUF3987 domain-containing protein [Pseudomonadota bacterium]